MALKKPGQSEFEKSLPLSERDIAALKSLRKRRRIVLGVFAFLAALFAFGFAGAFLGGPGELLWLGGGGFLLFALLLPRPLRKLRESDADLRGGIKYIQHGIVEKVDRRSRGIDYLVFEGIVFEVGAGLDLPEEGQEAELQYTPSGELLAFETFD